MVKTVTKTSAKKTPAKTKKAVVAVKSAKATTLVKKAIPKKTEAAKKTEHSAVALSVSVYDQHGKKSSTTTLPKEIFGEKINNQLLSQSVRVHLSNQRSGSASTKTRGEVEGSTRKIYNQKGTGRARHGNIRAPIFVGGGITFGPRPRIFSDKLPQKMKRKSLFSALSSQHNSSAISIIQGLDSLEPKTKLIANMVAAITDASRVLLVIEKDAKLILRAARNIEYVDVLFAQQLNTYDILNHGHIIFTKNAVAELKDFVTVK